VQSLKELLPTSSVPAWAIIVEYGEAFLAKVAELSSAAEAIAKPQAEIREWIETARELGRDIPDPPGRKLAFV